MASLKKQYIQFSMNNVEQLAICIAEGQMSQVKRSEAHKPQGSIVHVVNASPRSPSHASVFIP